MPPTASNQAPVPPAEALDPVALVGRLREWGRALGFQSIGIAGVELPDAERGLQAWLAAGYHGQMDYMARHGTLRSRPAALVPGTLSIISARMDYLPPEAATPARVLSDPTRGYVSRYALGRDYHKLLRRRLQQLADRLAAEIGPFGHRVFVDSAPVLETALAEQAGLGWKGKHSLLIHREAGSWFFLGELFTDLPLPPDTPARVHCGRCTACIDICPTRAIVADGVVDARRCISYLTIELDGPIPEEFRRPMGNRIYGCDDCQLICPWNRFARQTGEADFRARHGLDDPSLLALFAWSEAQFLRLTEGSALRRIGYMRWLRNLSVALGNAPYEPAIVAALHERRAQASPGHWLYEHISWAMVQQEAQRTQALTGGSVHTP
ncbi:MAG: tRNA epoxyqueuosine(34) reductase QueG [Pseudomonadota bacterium]